MTPNTKKVFRTNHAVTLFMEELTARVVAQTGIPSDRYHIGKIILQSLKDDPDFVLQVDGGLNVSETNGSVLERSIKCAVALKKLGLQQGDVIVFLAPNHLELTIPFYASFYLGLIACGVDRFLGVQELKDTFDVNQPKIIFCQSDKVSDIEAALKKSNLNAHIVTFDKGTPRTNFHDLLKDVDEMEVQNFKPTDFDPEETIGLLTATSGTCGVPKSAALSHKNILIGFVYFHGRFYDFPTPTRMYLFISPLQWLSAELTYVMSPILKYTRLQTSLDSTIEHTHHLINTYKPTFILASPTFILPLVASPGSERCDFSCFENMVIGGSFVSQHVIDKAKEVAPQADVSVAYGMSELAGLTLTWDQDMPPQCIGRPIGYLKHRLVKHETLEDIDEPNVVGELWVKGPTVFKGYYKNPEATKEIFSEDGWLKTGDLMYRDQYHHYIFVDRLKLLLKYRNHQISPVEVEQVLQAHPGVHEAAVVGVPDIECGDLPAAAIVLRPGIKVTAQEIKDWVKDRLTDSKQLRGGVIFMKALPLTVTTKLDRQKLKKMVIQMERE